ncbi:hypothetical protein CspeluHIS016_0106300 [Cutaneotrichosporon spelunceum]|uniref:Uncharacterized protein n=1 Tax=Cutaneotrichosporon spelunceum TaxID=1672016 RepID=A0AAD3TP28_9TREE|nr:hypothetical protein CspeluHIS016_0106300 [Cutaneotrichosporon spelunceum]
MSGRLVPILLAAGVGIVSGVYIWNEPLQQVTGLRPSPDGTKPVIDWKAQGSADKPAAPQEKPAEAAKPAAEPPKPAAAPADANK